MPHIFSRRDLFRMAAAVPLLDVAPVQLAGRRQQTGTAVRRSLRGGLGQAGNRLLELVGPEMAGRAHEPISRSASGAMRSIPWTRWR